MGGKKGANKDSIKKHLCVLCKHVLCVSLQDCLCGQTGPALKVCPSNKTQRWRENLTAGVLWKDIHIPSQ